MPFNLSQIFGGWRRKESAKKRGVETSRRERTLSSTPPRSPTLGVESPKTPSVFPRGVTKGKSRLAFHALVSPHISEKATMFGDGAYVFKVTDKANKIMVKKAVEERYGVKVENVNIANMPGKLRRKGAIIGHVSGFKKAVVKLSAGQTISEF